jgi:uncharacterized protein YgiM (DUF1202 family)
VKRVLLVVLLAAACSAPPPPAPKTAPVGEDRVIGRVRVTATALNVRSDASTDADVVKLVKKGETLSLLKDGGDWLRVKLASGEVGWVSAQHVAREGAKKQTARKRSGGCPADSDFAFVKTPRPAFSDTPKPGMVVVDASVNTKGDVVSTKIVSNTTGDETMAFLTEREIKSAKFTPPVRNCVPRNFIYTYKRTF